MSINSFLLLYAPLFISLVALEFFIGKRRGLALYTKEQSFASTVIMVIQRPLRLLPIGLTGLVFAAAFEYRLFDIPSGQWWYVPALFLAVEFAYYWMHRASHEVRWLWANHSVHHTIEEMNLLGSARLGWTEFISNGTLTFAPLALVGFHPLHVTIMLSINLIYQSWLHTTLIVKLGPLEGIVNTPSAHRVHHASNADYLDRNHGGVLMIFDRIFGTYVEERDNVPVEFGLVSPPQTSNPMKLAFFEWGNIIKDLNTYSIHHWPQLLFGPPGWSPDGKRQTSAELRAAYRATLPPAKVCPAE
ncbi:MAG: sterol desaturase family protein [Pseudomonadota bacterium]